MLRINVCIGSVIKLYRLYNPVLEGHVLFYKETTSFFKNEKVAIDLLEENEYPYFKDSMQSSYNYKRLHEYQVQEKTIVRDGISLNNYLKELGVSYKLTEKDIELIKSFKLIDILENTEVGKVLLTKEKEKIKTRIYDVR